MSESRNVLEEDGYLSPIDQNTYLSIAAESIEIIKQKDQSNANVNQIVNKTASSNFSPPPQQNINHTHYIGNKYLMVDSANTSKQIGRHQNSQQNQSAKAAYMSNQP